MFEINKLNLTAAGAQSLANADAGGFLVNPKTFRVGDIADAPSDVQEDILGNEVAKGNIHYVQVLSGNTAVFTLDIPADAGSTGGTDITEVVVYLEDGTPLGYAFLDNPYRKYKGRGVRIQVALHSTETELTTLNVTLSELGSIPSVPSVEDLPSPVDSLSNAISVLTLMSNSEGVPSPGIVCSHGEGNKRWGFYGFDRIFDEELGSAFLSEAEFELPDLINNYELQPNEELIVQVVNGNGSGQTKKVTVNNESLVSENPFVGVDSGSFVSVWRKQTGGGSVGSCPWPPKGDNVPADWVIKRGNGECPVWAPPANTVSSSTRLYRSPTKLKVESVTTAGTRDLKRYKLNMFPENANYVRMNMSGIANHRTGFALVDDTVEIFENFQENLDLEFRAFVREPSSGTMLSITPTFKIGDGVTKRFKMNNAVASPAEVIVFVDTIEQLRTSYTIDGEWLEFTEAPLSGTEIEINPFQYNAVEGYSTDVIVAQILIGSATNVITLPVTPESKNMLLVTQDGLAITKNHYGLADNKLVFNTKLDPGISVEVMIFQNVLSQGQESDDLPGVVVGAITHANGIDLIRHNMPPIQIPAPQFDMKGGAGIKVEGSFPFFKITNTFAPNVNADKAFTRSQHRTIEDTGSIVLTERVEFKGDICIMVAGNFAARLGPGFQVSTGSERIEYVVGVKTPAASEPDFGREVEGTGEAGFSFLGKPESNTKYAHANASQNMSFNIKRGNNTAGYVEVVVKARIVDANVSTGSRLNASLNVMVVPST